MNLHGAQCHSSQRKSSYTQVKEAGTVSFNIYSKICKLFKSHENMHLPCVEHKKLCYVYSSLILFPKVNNGFSSMSYFLYVVKKKKDKKWHIFS